MRLCRYEGWVVVRTLQVSETSLYSVSKFIDIVKVIMSMIMSIKNVLTWLE